LLPFTPDPAATRSPSDTEQTMSLTTIIIILVVLIVLGGGWGYSRRGRL
jgi:hypothetical protein